MVSVGVSPLSEANNVHHLRLVDHSLDNTSSPQSSHSDFFLPDSKLISHLTSWVNDVLKLGIEPSEFVTNLQTGVVLFKILCLIDANADTIDISLSAPEGSIRARENIGQCLQYIKSDLSAGCIRVFEPDNLIYLTRIRNVLNCVIDLINYASTEKGLKPLEFDRMDSINHEKSRSSLSPPSSKSSLANALARKTRLSITSPKRGSRQVDFSQAQQSSRLVSPKFMAPIIEIDDPGGQSMSTSVSDQEQSEPITTDQRSLSTASAAKSIAKPILPQEHGRPTPYLLSILRQMHIFLSSLPGCDSLATSCEMVMQNSSQYRLVVDYDDSVPITDIQIVVYFKGETLSPGYQFICDDDDEPIDLNQSFGDRQLYLAVERSRNKSPITELQLQIGDQDASPPYGYEKVFQSVTGLPGNLNFGSGAAPVCLCYRRGSSAPIVDINVSAIGTEGYRTISQAKVGDATLNSRSLLDIESDGPLPLFIHYKLSVFSIVARYESFLATGYADGVGNLSSMTFLEAQEMYYARAAAFLTICSYSCNPIVTHKALISMQMLSSTEHIPQRPFDLMLSTLLDLCSALRSDNEQLFRTAMKVACRLYHDNSRLISSRTSMKMIQSVIAYGCADPETNFAEYFLMGLLNQPCLTSCRVPPNHKVSVPKWIRDSVLGAVVDQVVFFGAVDGMLTKFQGFDVVDEQCMTHLSNTVSHLTSQPEPSQLLSMIMVLSAMLSEPPASYVGVESNRQEHGMMLDILVFILDRAQRFIKSSPPAIFLLRRVVIPALIESSITGTYRRPQFQRLLKCFIFVYRNYVRQLKVEMNAWIDCVLLDLLEHKSTSCMQKLDIIESLEMIMNSVQNLIDIFVNYDGAREPTPIFQRMIGLLSTISTEDLGTKSEVAVGPSNITAERAHLRRAATAMLVGLLEMQAQWLTSSLIFNNVYHPPASPSSHTSQLSPLSIPSSPIPLSSERKSVAKSSVYLSVNTIEDSRQHRRSSWRQRMESNDVNHNTIKKALSLTFNSSLSVAVRFMVFLGNTDRSDKSSHKINWRPVALFLYRCHSLDQNEVGKYLGSSNDEVFNEQDMNDLRHAFADLLDFTNRPFERALRSFVGDCGFWMPDDETSRNRLLHTFSEAYVRDNRKAFNSVQSAFEIAAAAYNVSNDVNTEEASWVSNLSSCGVPSDQLIDLYRCVKLTPIASRLERLANRQVQGEFERESQLVTQSEMSVHSALAFIRTQAMCRQRFVTGSNSVSIIQSMFKLTWVQYLGCLSAKLDESTSEITLNGLMHGTICGSLLSMPNEAKSFLNVLAKISYIASTTHNAEQQKLNLISGDFMEQPWVKRFLSSPVREGCDQLVDVIQGIKDNVSVNMERNRLVQVQVSVSLNVLSNASRQLTLTSDMLKLCNGGKSILPYRVYLLNDVLLYGKLEKGSVLLKKARAVHLMLCNVQTCSRLPVELSKMKTAVAVSELSYPIEVFHIRKSVIFFSKESKDCTLWVDTMRLLISDATRRHRHRIDAASQAPSVSTTISDQSCYLCLKYFTVFNRKHICPRCRYRVCTTCLTRKLVLPRVVNGQLSSIRAVKVCDGCFAFGRKMSLETMDIGDSQDHISKPDQ